MTTTPFRYRSEFALRYYNQGEAKGEAGWTQPSDLSINRPLA